MEWVFLVAAILAFPVIAIVALVRASSNARDLRDLSRVLIDTRREVSALHQRLNALGDVRPSAAEPPTPEPAASPRAAEPIAAKPIAQPLTPMPASVFEAASAESN